MHAEKLQSLIYRGYGKAARYIGTFYDFIRPNAAVMPLQGQGFDGMAAYDNDLVFDLDTAEPYQQVPVSLNAEDFNYSKPNKYGKPLWYGVFDAQASKVGDYLKGEAGTLFIATMQRNLPILLVECNRTIAIWRTQQQAGVGAIGYGGNTAATETVLMSGWPASLLIAGRGERTEQYLPGDKKQPNWLLLLPSYLGVVIQNADIITDDLGRRYVVSAAELSDLGWRITCLQVVA